MKKEEIKTKKQLLEILKQDKYGNLIINREKYWSCLDES